MNDRTKTILCFVIVVAALVIYLVCACMPSMEEIREMKEKFKAKKEAKKRDNK